jgi:hypothetical protein
VFENSVLKRICERKRKEMRGDLRKLYTVELHNMYSSLRIIRMVKSRRMGWTGNVARKELERNSYRLLLGRPEGKRALRGSRRRWTYNIKIDLGEVG